MASGTTILKINTTSKADINDYTIKVYTTNPDDPI